MSANERKIKRNYQCQFGEWKKWETRLPSAASRPHGLFLVVSGKHVYYFSTNVDDSNSTDSFFVTLSAIHFDSHSDLSRRSERRSDAARANRPPSALIAFQRRDNERRGAKRSPQSAMRDEIRNLNLRRPQKGYIPGHELPLSQFSWRSLHACIYRDSVSLGRRAPTLSIGSKWMWCECDAVSAFPSAPSRG